MRRGECHRTSANAIQVDVDVLISTHAIFACVSNDRMF